MFLGYKEHSLYTSALTQIKVIFELPPNAPSDNGTDTFMLRP